MTDIQNPLIPFDPVKVGKLFTGETAGAILASERVSPGLDRETADRIAAGLLYCSRNFIEPEMRNQGKPPTDIRSTKFDWLQSAQRISVAVRLPEEKAATAEQKAETLKIIGQIAGELDQRGYKLLAGALREYLTHPAPGRPGPKAMPSSTPNP